MKALLLHRSKSILSASAILEMTIWKVPSAVAVSTHKYSLFYGRKGDRIVGYDNERLKGDHRHLRERETPYSFTTVEALISDFLQDVRNQRRER